ncbi:hypothetical protein R2325_16685 [Mycobacteroides chelonae]|uniref:ribonuclease H-like domain-containing protein n=1 Tax=Mycobacteroides chelonae TaxID=1774 RepID=UPI002DE44205|nr:hypothetical protein [Mycobacteroides chelonae]MEC4873622.1 hypothetical protein [Mycobacteroides chelonae]
MSANILVLDIERQSALVDGVWAPGEKKWVRPDQIVEPSRTICFAYRWAHESRTRFISEWDGNLEQDNSSMAPGGGHLKMITTAHELLNKADYVVGWNSKNFDMKHLRSHMFAYNMKPPSPHVDLDLMHAVSKNFAFMYKSMAYISKIKQMAGKESTEAGLWRTLRYGQGDVLRRARRSMKRYNIRDVDQTLELFYDMRPWLTGMNLGLFEDDDELHCPNCNSTHLTYQGSRKNATYAYRRFQCQDCGKWGRDTRSFKRVEVTGI